ncbi:MAG TPA: isoprenylcysteine carboxylmethyltransferase family protein [Vicinamibacterales bacterium]|jgi:protein-S-isoprenylcysteine O-methyltransferase Ste14
MTSTRAPGLPARLFAWGGGAAFAAALAYCGWFVVVTLERPVAVMTRPALALAVVIDVALFGLFAAHHSLAARPPLKRWVTRWLGAGLERSLYVWLASGLLALTCACWQGMPGTLYRTSGLAAASLTAVEIAGLWLTVAATRVMDPLELAGIRQLQRQASPTTLQIVGPYHLVRHPLYLGWILMMFAAPVMTASRLLFAMVSSGYLLLAIPWEERALVRIFGDEYERYRRRVPWKVIPFVS